MKINELLTKFTIQMSNEERDLLDKMGNDVKVIHAYTDRERFVIESLIRKALVSKIVRNGSVLVVANENYKP
jgi:hypothetical protein